MQETRLYDPDKDVTRSLRSKEDAHDYRYFPDPDLLPLELDDAFLDECRASLPELPDAKRKRYEGAGHHAYNAGVLTAEVETARWFDALLGCRRGARRRRANWVSSNCSARSTGSARASTTARSRPAQAAELLALVADGTISGTHRQAGVRDHARDRRRRRRRSSRSAGLKQTSDTGAIDAAIDKVLAANADKVAEYQRRQGGAVRLLRRPDDEGDGRARPTRSWSTSGCGRSSADRAIAERSDAAIRCLAVLACACSDEASHA